LKKILFFLFFLETLFAFSQEKFTLSGTVSEMETGETLIGVNVIIPEIQTGTITNEYGFYSITLPEGDYEVYFSIIGFSTETFQVSLSQNIQKDISLKIGTEQLDEVIIVADKEKLNIRKPQMSVNSLSIETIRKMPVLLGETDVIKSITLLPGVTNTGEGANGFNVRGGAVDQNLILLDMGVVFRLFWISIRKMGIKRVFMQMAGLD